MLVGAASLGVASADAGATVADTGATAADTGAPVADAGVCTCAPSSPEPQAVMVIVAAATAASIFERLGLMANILAWAEPPARSATERCPFVHSFVLRSGNALQFGDGVARRDGEAP